MKILHVIHSARTEGGGPIEGVKQLSKSNIVAGHQIEVVSLDAPNEPWVKTFPLPIHALGPSYLSYGYTPRLVPWMRENHRRFDVVIINGIWQYNSFGVWRALHESSTPYCLFIHGMLDPWFKHHYPLKHLKKWLYWPWGDYRVLRDALAVFFTSEEERRLARRSFWLYHCDEIVIPYGINAPAGDRQQQREMFLSKHPHLRDKRILLYLSRIHEKKGCDLLIQAFAKLVNTTSKPIDPQIHLVMAGPDDTAYARQLKDMAAQAGIEHRITWPGMLSGEMKWGAFHSADAFILPSHQENFGIAVAEALACGLPVLITSKVNIWREIKLHNAGIIESDDLTGTEHLLDEWLACDPQQWQTLRENARRCFQTCFHVEQFAENFIKSLRLLGLAA